MLSKISGILTSAGFGPSGRRFLLGHAVDSGDSLLDGVRRPTRVTNEGKTGLRHEKRKIEREKKEEKKEEEEVKKASMKGYHA